MTNQQKIIQENKAAAFDWLVLGISFSLGFVFPTLWDFVRSPGFSLWMLIALILYSAGAWLKQEPLYYRLYTSGNPHKGVPYTLFFIIGHWIILFVVTIFSISAIRKITGIPLANPQKGEDGWVMLLEMAIASVATWLVFRSQPKFKKGVVLSSTYIFRRELIGDICLVIGVSIFTFAFWEKGVIALLASRPTNSISDIWFLFLFLAIAYMLCYLPLRYLFLVEDHFSSRTWKRMLLILGILLLRSLFVMLKI